jgi:DivIVA domain-containing protein
MRERLGHDLTVRLSALPGRPTIGGTMDVEDIGRLRVQGFTVARRGYDRRDVDRFLDSLIEWIETDAPKELGDLAVKRKLELVGKSTAHILLTTEKESEQLRSQAEQECEELRADADAASVAVRRDADEYATKTRDKADQDARRTTEAAQAKAKRIVDDANGRRTQVEGVIAELEARRDAVLSELERLRDDLASTIGEHATPRRFARDGDANGERSENVARAGADPGDV